jgi:hypothetical protein
MVHGESFAIVVSFAFFVMVLRGSSVFEDAFSQVMSLSGELR